MCGWGGVASGQGKFVASKRGAGVSKRAASGGAVLIAAQRQVRQRTEVQAAKHQLLQPLPQATGPQTGAAAGRAAAGTARLTHKALGGGGGRRRQMAAQGRLCEAPTDRMVAAQVPAQVLV